MVRLITMMMILKDSFLRHQKLVLNLSCRISHRSHSFSFKLTCKITKYILIPICQLHTTNFPFLCTTKLQRILYHLELCTSSSPIHLVGKLISFVTYSLYSPDISDIPIKWVFKKQ